MMGLSISSLMIVFLFETFILFECPSIRRDDKLFFIGLIDHFLLSQSKENLWNNHH